MASIMSPHDNLLGEGHGYAIATLLVAAPALSMTFGSMAVRLGVPSDIVQARFQNLSAGLLIGALLAEIYPMLHDRLIGEDGAKHVEVSNCLSALVGFLLALGVMYGLHSLEHSQSPVEAVEEVLHKASTAELEDAEAPASPGSVAVQRMATAQIAKLRTGGSNLDVAISALSKIQKDEGDIDVDSLDEHLHLMDFAIDCMRRTCHGVDVLTGTATQEARAKIAELVQDVEALQGMSPRKVGAMDWQLQRASASVRRLHAQTTPGSFRRWALRRTASQASQLCEEHGSLPGLPWGLVFAVAIDAAVDGMLIGLSTSTSVGAGMLMAIATVIEMGFLGYSFACTLMSGVKQAKRSPGVLVPLLALPPLCLAGFGVGAYAIGAALQQCFVFTGLVSFSLVAVLFLVIQELLLEAAEKNQDENWNVSIFIYVGLFISFGLEVVL
ncbi:unnamed protein product [Symbiodinium natans]|uniref:Zinc transporter ZIP1 n=1 Tax=Symbiodinium natans TaxID=878477 RepID=A0A812LIP5_9DINO|nr:unnamed protein product [Symbiodinium natans]